MPDRRSGDARRMLRPGDRGLPARAQVHDPGRLPVRRVPGDRLGAVEDPVARRPRPRSASTNATDPATFRPYQRDPDTLARPWAVPGTPGLEHRIGGLEKADITGNVSYDPDNHHRMQTLRAAKVAGIADDIPPLEVFGPEQRRAADPRLGLDLRRDPLRRRAPDGRRPVRRPRPPAPSQPVPGQHGGGPPELPAGADPGGQPRPAAHADPGALPDRRRSATTGSAASRSASPRSSRKPSASSRSERS